MFSTCVFLFILCPILIFPFPRATEKYYLFQSDRKKIITKEPRETVREKHEKELDRFL